MTTRAVRAINEVQRAAAAGETMVPAGALFYPGTLPVPNASYPPEPVETPEPPGTARPAPEPETPGVSHRQQVVMTLLLGGATITSAARAVGVNRRTVSEWVHQPGFAREFARQRAEAMGAGMQRLSGLVDQATGVLEEALSPSQDIGVRLRAALGVLGLVGVQHARLVDLPDVTPARPAQAEPQRDEPIPLPTRTRSA
jgi:transposase-like protein